MKLNDLKPNEGAKKEPKRKGHGISAGQGKTAGRGTKGPELPCRRDRAPLPPGRQPTFLPPLALYPW